MGYMYEIIRKKFLHKFRFNMQTLSSKHYLIQDVTFFTDLPLLRIGSFNESLLPSRFNIY